MTYAIMPIIKYVYTVVIPQKFSKLLIPIPPRHTVTINIPLGSPADILCSFFRIADRGGVAGRSL